MADYEDLFDIEQRPGAGLELWGSVVERQLGRVEDAGYRHRLHHTPDNTDRESHADAENHLHGEVYFLVLAIRRVLLFSEALSERLGDDRLEDALATFDREAPGAREVRNLFEHVDEYLLDTPAKRMQRFQGRIAPVLILRWDASNVAIAYGDERFDVTLAALAASELAKSAFAIWSAALDEITSANSPDAPANDGLDRAIEVEIGPSTVIQGGSDGPEVQTGRLLDVRIREIGTVEAEKLKAAEQPETPSSGGDT